MHEYAQEYGLPERWASNGYIKKLQTKNEGFFTYWRETRECDDKYVRRTKLYYYDAEKENQQRARKK